jgi:poly(A) polymerase
VGGGVRDLLMHRQPKDFDISTSAAPEEIKRLFRRCILIGRRFRLAHVRFGKKIFEVSTFRSGGEDEDLIVRDNEWGTPEEDVLRRDFTMNGLFYDAHEKTIIDFVGGYHDIQAGLLRTIGSPLIRFKQDPVRMIRLLKFRARFGFHVDDETHQSMVHCVEEIKKSSPARVLEECLRMLESGASEPFFRLMQEHGFFKLLFPFLSESLQGTIADKVFSYLHAADSWIKHLQGTPPDRAVLTSSLLFPLLEHRVQSLPLPGKSAPLYNDIQLLTHELIEHSLLHAFTHFPRRIRASVAFILNMQFRLTPYEQKRGKRFRFLHHPEFPSALDFLHIRAFVNKELRPAYTHWRNAFQR